jgi:hypothetical protein
MEIFFYFGGFKTVIFVIWCWSTDTMPHTELTTLHHREKSPLLDGSTTIQIVWSNVKQLLNRCISVRRYFPLKRTNLQAMEDSQLFCLHYGFCISNRKQPAIGTSWSGHVSRYTAAYLASYLAACSDVCFHSCAYSIASLAGGLWQIYWYTAKIHAEQREKEKIHPLQANTGQQPQQPKHSALLGWCTNTRAGAVADKMEETKIRCIESKTVFSSTTEQIQHSLTVASPFNTVRVNLWEKN